MLTNLVQPSAPDWLRSKLTAALSLIPMRPDGVRQTILFLARSLRDPMSLEREEMEPSDNSAHGLSISLETLNHATKLLSSVPSSVSTDEYIFAIGPQLLALLDENDEDMQRAASYIIGFGILSKKTLGAPGTVGWKIFVLPIFESLKPQDDGSGEDYTYKGKRRLPRVLVSNKSLHLALQRLSRLILVHPNPGLTKRLIQPMLLPLWALSGLTAECVGIRDYSKGAMQLMSTYMKVCAGGEVLLKISDNLLWEGGPRWSYNICPTGFIIHRQAPQIPEPPNEVHEQLLVYRLDARIGLLMELIELATVTDADVAQLFLHVTKGWLLGTQDGDRQVSIGLQANSENDTIRKITSAKIAERLLNDHKDKVSSNPENLIELVSQILLGYCERLESTKPRDQGAAPVTLSTIGSIVDRSDLQTNKPAPGGDSNEDPMEIISIAISLLSTLLTSPEFVSSIKIRTVLTSVRSALTRLIDARANLPDSIIMASTNAISLTDLQLSASGGLGAEKPNPNANHVDDRKTHALALKYLSDEIPPVRAEGLSILISLISTSSPILDIGSTAILLLSLLQDEEDFINLSVIKAMGLLAARHSRTVVKLLVKTYKDDPEGLSLDRRLKVGEALLKTVESLGEALNGDIATTVTNGMISVAGRRSKKPRAEQHKIEREQEKAKAISEAESAWGGEVPRIPDDTPPDAHNKTLAKIVEGWEGTADEEDLRVRTSALSILGVAVETNIAAIGSAIVSTAIDLALAILKFEKAEEAAILRRAAIILFSSLVKAMDEAHEEGRGLGFGFAGDSLAEVIEVLRYVEATDTDDMVTGHAREVIGSLEEWQIKSVMGIKAGREATSSISTPGTQLAGLSLKPETSRTPRPHIEEID